MDPLKTLESLGFPIPSPAWMVGAFFFGIVGFLAWRRGRKAALPRLKWVGIALMVLPNVVYVTWLLYAIGLILCAGLGFEISKQRKLTNSGGKDGGHDTPARPSV